MQYNWAGDYGSWLEVWQATLENKEKENNSQTHKLTYKGKDKQSNFLCLSFWRPSFRKPQGDGIITETGMLRKERKV